jgi:hypothetical protein
VKRKPREKKRKPAKEPQVARSPEWQAEYNDLKALARSIHEAAGNKGYALFIIYDGKPMYLSNAYRPDVVLALREWLAKIPVDAVMTEFGTQKPLSEDSDPFQGYERIKLQKLCVQIAAVLEMRNQIVLFLFDLGDSGNMAFKTNVPYARQSVQLWVDSQT